MQAVTEATPTSTQQPSSGSILFNSVVAAVLAAELMILTHELFHALPSLALGQPGTIFPFAWFGDADAGRTTEATITGLATPLSLLTGALMAAWQPLRRTGGFWHLVWVWFAFTSIMEGVGYLMITLMGAGDTAMVFSKLELPLWLGVLVTALGVGGMFLAARAFAPFVARATGYEKKPAWALAFWPWLIGTGVCVALALTYLALSPVSVTPGESIAIAMASSAIFVAAPMSFIFGKKVAARTPREPLDLPAKPIVGIVVLAVVVIAKLALTQGLHLG